MKLASLADRLRVCLPRKDAHCDTMDLLRLSADELDRLTLLSSALGDEVDAMREIVSPEGKVTMTFVTTELIARVRAQTNLARGQRT